MVRPLDAPARGNGQTTLLVMYQDLLARYDALVREVMAMKREGFLPALPEPAVQPTDALPSEVREAINALVAGAVEGGDELEGKLTQQAWSMQRRGMAPDAMVAAIEAGEDVTL